MIPRVVKFLWTFDRRTRIGFAFMILSIFVSSLFEMVSLGLFIPLLQEVATPGKASNLFPVREWIAPLAEQTHIHILVLLGSFVFAFYALKNGLLALIIYKQQIFIRRIEADYRNTIYAQYLNRPYAYFLNHNSAEIIRTVVQSTGAVFSGILIPFFSMVMELVLIVAALVVLFAVEPTATLTVVVVLGSGLGAFYLLIRRHLTAWGLRLEDVYVRIYMWINQGIGAIREIRILGRDRYFHTMFAQQTDEIARVSAISNTVQLMPRLVGEVIILGTFLIFVSFTLIANQGSFVDAVPVLGIFAAAAFRIAPSVNRLVNSATSIRHNAAALDSVTNADMSSGPPPSAKPVQPLPFQQELRIDGLSFNYAETDRPALNNITFTITKGETVALVGPSGSGKSTLADIVLGLLDPTTGSITADGVNIRSNMTGWQRQLGFVPQTVYLSDDTLRRNIAFGLADNEIDTDQLVDATRMAQLDDVISALPNGLDTFVGERGTRLSGGQRQRVGIARALYNDPDLLVLDEATSALDSETESRITAITAGFRGKKTLLIIAHRLSTVRHCDRLVFLSNGRVEGCGTFDELQRTCPGFERMVQSGDISAASAGETVE